MTDLKAQAEQMRACADAVDSSASALAQAQEMRAQAADLSAQADALEQHAHDSLEATGCYRPTAASTDAGAVAQGASSAVPAAPALLWDGSKFATV